MLAGNELNDREWATLVWLAIVIVLLLWSKRTRRPVLVLVRTATTSLLAVLAAGLWIWTAGVVWFGERVHLWTGDLVKDTVIWALGPALALIYGLGPSDSNFFRRAVLGTARNPRGEDEETAFAWPHRARSTGCGLLNPR